MIPLNILIHQLYVQIISVNPSTEAFRRLFILEVHTWITEFVSVSLRGFLCVYQDEARVLWFFFSSDGSLGLRITLGTAACCLIAGVNPTR